MSTSESLPILLVNDGDVILPNKKGLIKVGDFKNDLLKSIKESLAYSILCYGLFNLHSSTLNSYFRFGFEQISGSSFPETGLECELLQVGGQKWLHGKLKILMNINFKIFDPVFVERLNEIKIEYAKFDINSIRSLLNELQLEPDLMSDTQIRLDFYPDQEDDLLEPSLDDIRQMSVE
ncbi:KGK domain-containing protein [Thermosynechococcaceae cyanobacterium BACA0444]|uniref:KGK domain-containing protein n=1 Tax=Pseudocalidococcus azoricus BACA0444 TaxID=2918990 RepID=A0AAE4FQ85_9CYAN|nr:KGK domain-containing protein [Pseudocalidococcus azoricus]MDS3860165.1 KGK domain-containing protein [Pseudocalidococcus azoricus BACA0444]